MIEQFQHIAETAQQFHPTEWMANPLPRVAEWFQSAQPERVHEDTVSYSSSALSS